LTVSQTVLSKHNAPSVTYPLGRSHWQALVLLAFWLAALLLVGVWTLASQELGWRQAAGGISLVGAGWAARHGWKNAAVGQLTWDGQVWRWEGPGYQAGVAEYALLVALDFQKVMLLRLENQAHAKLWLWAERGALPERWLDLRRAVYSPHRSLNGVVRPG
jgi:toxin CptA